MRKITAIAKEHKSDYYVKKFDTSDHLISMLFATFAHCTSLREVAASMLGLKGKMNHFQLKNIPYRSTLSDANKRRSHEVFQSIYYSLLNEYQPIISDSRQIYSWENRLEIIDPSTISLFKDILSCVGRKPSNGKMKGGIKVHTQINLQEKVPKLISFSPARTHDKQFLRHLPRRRQLPYRQQRHREQNPSSSTRTQKLPLCRFIQRSSTYSHALHVLRHLQTQQRQPRPRKQHRR
jgi:hypothetical protein